MLRKPGTRTQESDVIYTLDSAGNDATRIAKFTKRSEAIVESHQDDVTIEDVTGSEPVVFAVPATHVESSAVNPHHDREKIAAGCSQLDKLNQSGMVYTFEYNRKPGHRGDKNMLACFTWGV